jgi:hypothetical protein
MTNAARGDDRAWPMNKIDQARKRRAERRSRHQAPTDPDSTLPEPREMTAEEAVALLDQEAQRYFGISGEEFQRRFEAGELDVEEPHVWEVALMLPAVGR